MEYDRLAQLHSMAQQLRDTSSLKQKSKILNAWLAENPPLADALAYVYDPYRQFYLTHEVAIAKAKDAGAYKHTHPTIWQVLDRLSRRMVTGYEAIAMWNHHLRQMPAHLRDTAGKVLNRDLKCGLGVKTVNRVLRARKLPLIREFEVALGVTWEGEDIFAKGSADWWASRKLDGVRCIALIENGVVTLHSRTGHTLHTLKVLAVALARYSGPPVALDGELALRRSDDKDDFKGIVGQVQRHDFQILQPVLHAFDCIPLHEFRLGSGDDCFTYRQRQLTDVVDAVNSPMLKIVHQMPVRKVKDVMRMMGRSQAFGWEGLILREDGPYKAGRSKNIYKVKYMRELEAVITDIEIGEMGVVRDGKHTMVKCMTRANILYKGNVVGVGSGWTMDQRQRFTTFPHEIVGKTITVQYFETSMDKMGYKSLRFPVVKAIHGKVRDV